MDDAIAQVVNVTDTTPEKALQYVTLADGDPSQAIALFYENNGADLVGNNSSSAPSFAQPTTSSHLRGPGDSQNPINVDGDDAISDDNDPAITGFRKGEALGGQGASPHGRGLTFEDDAAMARRLQEEMYGGSSAMDPEASVRAPIARQSETLLGPGADAGTYSDAEIPAAVERRMRDFQRRRAQRKSTSTQRSFPRSHLLTTLARAGIFNQQATSSIWTGEEDANEREVLSQTTGGASEASSKSSMLARMFQPPWDLMYKGPWDSAREEGREQKKWLLVNIQDGSVFDCQVLNRDLWKNSGVAETVRENFIFLQYNREDVRAEQYLQYYFQQHHDIDLYPHIAIVDPRTGEQVKVWSGEVPKAPEFLMQLHEFLDRYSLNNSIRNPVAKRKPEPKKDKDVHLMTEEEQLERAMQASLATQTNDAQLPRADDPDDLTRSIGNLDGKGKQNAADAERGEADAMSIFENGNQVSAVPLTSPFSLILSDRPHSEPAAGPHVTRIQFRLPAGRVIRRFTLSDPVRRIYEWLKAEPLEGKEGAEFELVAMGKNLMGSAETTIEQAGLKNGTVMVEFVEE